MKVIFSDPTPRWVPFVAAVLILAGVWFGANLNHVDPNFTIDLVVGLLGVLVVALFFQGRYYWTGQVASLASDGMRYEAVTSIWIGSGRRISFAATEAKQWTAKAGSAAPGARPELSTVRFSVRGSPLVLNFTNPKVADLAALTAINPAFFAKAKGDYTNLKNIGG